MEPVDVKFHRPLTLEQAEAEMEMTTLKLMQVMRCVYPVLQMSETHPAARLLRELDCDLKAGMFSRHFQATGTDDGVRIDPLTEAAEWFATQLQHLAASLEKRYGRPFPEIWPLLYSRFQKMQGGIDNE